MDRATDLKSVPPELMESFKKEGNVAMADSTVPSFFGGSGVLVGVGWTLIAHGPFRGAPPQVMGLKLASCPQDRAVWIVKRSFCIKSMVSTRLCPVLPPILLWYTGVPFFGSEGTRGRQKAPSCGRYTRFAEPHLPFTPPRRCQRCGRGW